MEESISITICHTCGFAQEVDKSYSLEWPHACAAWLERLFWSKDHTLNCPDFDE